MNEPKKRRNEGEPVTRGLPSVEEARQQRRTRQMLPPKFWAWAAVFIGAGIIFWWKVEEGEIQKLKSELLGRQRAVVDQLGPKWLPLKKKITTWTQECAAAPFKEKPGAKLVDSWDFRKMEGIYLRLAQSAARDAESIRLAAQKSLHDGFTSCLLLVPNPNPVAGDRCETTQDCAKGQLCNDYKHCAAYSQPYNLRLAFRTMFVMTDDYVREIQAIDKKLTIRGAMATFDAANKYDLPVAADLLTRAQYFLVVVDEAAKNVDPDRVDHSLPNKDAKRADDRSIPTAPHSARVCVWRLSDGKKMLATRGDAAGALMGSKRSVPLRTRVAMQRQANSCALALATREAIGASGGAKVPTAPNSSAGPAGSVGSASPSAVPAATATAAAPSPSSTAAASASAEGAGAKP